MGREPTHKVLSYQEGIHILQEMWYITELKGPISATKEITHLATYRSSRRSCGVDPQNYPYRILYDL